MNLIPLVNVVRVSGPHLIPSKVGQLDLNLLRSKLFKMKYDPSVEWAGVLESWRRIP